MRTPSQAPPEHIWPWAAPSRPLAGCPTATLTPGHLVLETSRLPPPWRCQGRKCAQRGPRVPGVQPALRLGAVRKQALLEGQGGWGGRPRAPLTQADSNPPGS